MTRKDAQQDIMQLSKLGLTVSDVIQEHHAFKTAKERFVMTLGNILAGVLGSGLVLVIGNMILGG